jgi:hypothetical protein
MEARKRLRLKIAVASFAAIASIAMAVPALASANVVDDLLSGLGLGAPAPSGSDSPSTSGDTKAGTPPNYVPPLHGTNPHGEGDAATVQIPLLSPLGPNPVSGTPGQPETVVLGSSKGEQNPDGSYHGHITILSLLGAEILGVDSTPGQSNQSPIAPLQNNVLTPLCTGSGGALCVTLLQADSSTTGTGSTNTFRTAAVNVGTGGQSISASAVQSTGDISSDGTCQTATGTSNVANANVLGAVTADALSGSSQSKACNDGTPSSTTQSSSVLNLNGTGIPVPATGCDNGTPNTNFTVMSPLVATVCNADDTTSGQTTAPYGVREALTVFALILGVPTVKATTAGPESHAVAPAAAAAGAGPTTPAGTSPSNNGPGNGNNNNNNGNGPGNGSTSTEASGGNGNGSLPFTGADLPWLAMLGLGLIGAGCAIVAVTDGARRPRLEG